MSPPLSWDIAPCHWEIGGWSFRTANWSHLQGLVPVHSSDIHPLTMGPPHNLEISSINHQWCGTASQKNGHLSVTYVHTETISSTKHNFHSEISESMNWKCISMSILIFTNELVNSNEYKYLHQDFYKQRTACPRSYTAMAETLCHCSVFMFVYTFWCISINDTHLLSTRL